MGKQWKRWQTLFSWAPKSLWMVTAAMNLKDAGFLAEKLWQTKQHKKKKKKAETLLWQQRPLVKATVWENKVVQLCPTLCNPMVCSPPGISVNGIFQARVLELVAISFSNEWKWKVQVKTLSCVWLLATPWTAAHQAPPSMGFSRQEYWSWVPSPSPNVVHSRCSI